MNFGRFPRFACLAFWYKQHVRGNASGASVEWYWQGKIKVIGESLFQCHVAHTNTRMEWPGSNSGLRVERPAPNRLKNKMKLLFFPMLHDFRKSVAPRPRAFVRRVSAMCRWRWEARARSQVISVRFVVGQSVTDQVFQRVLRFSHVIIMPPLLHTKPPEFYPNYTYRFSSCRTINTLFLSVIKTI
jgi:hypothetical protein